MQVRKGSRANGTNPRALGTNPRAQRGADSPLRYKDLSQEELVALPYNEYRQTKHWRTVSLAAKRRAGHRCEACGVKGRLHAHHRTYARLGAELPEDLAALCRLCHELQHHMEPNLRAPR